MTIALSEVKQKECKHLCVENFAAITFFKLLCQLDAFKSGKRVYEYVPD